MCCRLILRRSNPRGGLLFLDCRQIGIVLRRAFSSIVCPTFTRSSNAGPITDSAPAWFVRMDRNADGDLSPREFLGTAEQFQSIDANDDALIDRAEADRFPLKRN